MTTKRRQPIDAPCAWRGDALGATDAWIRTLSPAALREIDQALRAVKADGLTWQSINRDNFPLDRLARELADIADELEQGRGLLLLRGLSVAHDDTDDLRRIFVGIGSHLGTIVPQSARGERLGEIQDEGPEVGQAHGQMAASGGETFLSSRARVHTTGQLRFHTDRTDVVALLCIRPARSGGVSKIASSVAIHNAMLDCRPDLLERLFQAFPRSRFGEETKDPRLTYDLPVFAMADGHFTSHYSRTYIEAAQMIPGVRRLSAAQIEALDLLHALAEDLCVEMRFQPGDMQFLNSHVTYHARTPYVDHADADRKRLLFRLWLSMANSRPLPSDHAVLWGDTTAGALRGGIRPDLV